MDDVSNKKTKRSKHKSSKKTKKRNRLSNDAGKKTSSKLKSEEEGKKKKRSSKLKKIKEAKEQKQKQPDPYQKIRSNIYPSDKPKLKNASTRCGCEPVPDMLGCNTPDCLNFMMFAECDPAKCALKSLCQNTRLRYRKYCKSAVKYFGSKGWGLYAKEDLLPGTLVIEYVGEIIDADRKEERLWEGKTTKKFYMMSLNANETIDATSKGNRSRFLNHCCDPNCVTQKWLVDGVERIGVFTKCSVTSGSELTYNYFGDMGSDNQKFFGSVKQPCFCASPRCGKWLGAKPIRLPGDDERDAANALVEERKTRKLVEKETAAQRFLRISQTFLGELDLSRPNGTFPTLASCAVKERLEDKVLNDGSKQIKIDAVKDDSASKKSVDSKKKNGEKSKQKSNKEAALKLGQTGKLLDTTAAIGSVKETDVIKIAAAAPAVPLFLKRNLAICKPLMRRLIRESLEEYDKEIHSKEEFKMMPGIFDRGGRLIHLAKELGQPIDERELSTRGRRTRVSGRMRKGQE